MTRVQDQAYAATGGVLGGCLLLVISLLAFRVFTLIRTEAAVEKAASNQQAQQAASNQENRATRLLRYRFAADACAQASD